jgi:hypothetical protein
MARITFNNKTTLVDQPSVAHENKVIADDINEIKSVVNANADATVPVELYNNSSGTTGSINNLADDVSNYKYLEIFYSYNDARQSTKIIGNKASLIVHTTGNNQTYILFKEVTFSGTSMTVNSYQQWNNVWGTSNITASNTNGIYVIRIVGYK